MKLTPLESLEKLDKLGITITHFLINSVWVPMTHSNFLNMKKDDMIGIVNDNTLFIVNQKSEEYNIYKYKKNETFY